MELARAYNLLYRIAQSHPELKVTVQQSARGALWAGAGALVGGLLGGRNGMLAGAASGAAWATMSSENFKSVLEILDEMSQRDRDKLARAVIRECSKLGINYMTAQATQLSRQLATQLLEHVMEEMDYTCS
jgi:hypothetical protein